MLELGDTLEPVLPAATVVLVGLTVSGCLSSTTFMFLGSLGNSPHCPGCGIGRPPSVESSVQPSLAWLQFPEKNEDYGINLAKVEDVTYQLRIRQMKNGAPGPVVYDRRGIGSTSHKIEKPLAHGFRHFWSVSAEFVYEGEKRRTEWLRITSWPNYAVIALGVDYDIDNIRPKNYYKFRTPEF